MTQKSKNPARFFVEQDFSYLNNAEFKANIINHTVNPAREQSENDYRPETLNIFAPVPKIRPSATVNIGHSDWLKCRF